MNKRRKMHMIKWDKNKKSRLSYIYIPGPHGQYLHPHSSSIKHQAGQTISSVIQSAWDPDMKPLCMLLPGNAIGDPIIMENAGCCIPLTVLSSLF